MTTLRSNLPSRIRQLLSADGALGPSIKLDSEPPPKIKAFINKVIQCPLQDIAIPLSGFRWEYIKGNFHHWRPLFLHFDTYFKTYLSCRNDLLLSDKILEDDSPFPKHAVLQILRVMQTILENCNNKSSFDGLEHFKLLLASTDPEVLIAALETLSALVKINPSKMHVGGKMIGCASVNSYLLSLAQGWGSKEEGLGLYSCVMANETTQDDGLNLFPSDVENDSDKLQCRIGSTLYFELHGNAQSTEESSNNVNNSSSLGVINIPDLHLQKEDDLKLMKRYIEEYRVPPELRFSLLTRIRYARAFRSPKICRLYSRICLLAFVVLVQSSDASVELNSFFANEPEYTNELIRIVRSEESVSGTIRTQAMLALGAQLAAYSASHERARILSVSSISFAGGNRMILLNVLQRAVRSLKNSNDPTSLAFVEALLQFYLLHVVSSSATGSNIRGSGMVPTFLPLLEDSDPLHLHLVCFAVKTLQKLMDYSSSAVSLFKESGGVELLSQRLQIEVHRVIGLAGDNDNSMVIGESSRYSDNQLYSQKRLIKASLKALGSATYGAGNSSRVQQPHDSSLPATLSLIFGNVDKFGGDIYYSAVTVLSETIHKDPTCFSALHEMGLPDAFISSVVAGILPSAKALTCVPNGLGAICLNAKGLEAVKESLALRFLVDIFTSKKYVMAMNEAIVPLANAVEELLRHVSSLRSTGVDIILEIIDKIASFTDSHNTGPEGKANGSTAMEMDSEDKENAGRCCLVDSVDSAADGISNEQFIQLSIFHLMILVHRTMENSETCRLFVEKSGIDALLKLLLQPTIVQSSDGMSIALHSTMVFKGFTQHHSAPLARAFCSSLGDHLKKALSGFGAVSGSFLLEPRMASDGGIFSSLFLVEFLLFIAASKDNRWVTALLTEFGNGSKDVLEDIGRVHREVSWQIALLEDTKSDAEDDNAGSTTESQQSETNTSETEEQRFNSFRQFLDPLLRRRTSGWSIESQFLDLISLYRDLGRATSSQQRTNSDGPSNLRIGSSHQFQHSGSSDAVGPLNKKEYDQQRSYYTSCCDMVRSLSFHITHLFQEMGKVMSVPSRRRDDIVNVSPAAKSVASTFASIAFDHLNFEGPANSSGSKDSISTKCRYFGRVIDFIDVSLLERADSCNAVLLNCLYGHGVIQSVLKTFVATSELLFTVRAPASPMETDDGNSKQDEREDIDHSWIYGPLASYGKLMDHLVTSSFILSPFTKHLLAQPLANGNIPFPRDAETFVKVLQSMVLKAILPLWTHPQFVDCSYDFTSTVISIIRHVYSGVEVKNVSSSNTARITGPPPNETTISMIVEMGFTRSRAEEALRQVGSNSVELAMEWLFSHQEETEEDNELARALAMSLGNESDTKEAVANENTQQLEEEIVQLPPVEELLSTCAKLLQMKEPLAFPVDQKLNPEIAEQLKKDGISSHQTPLSIDENKQNKLQSALGLSSKHIEMKEQKRLIEIACSCIRNQLASETMHAVLQLCSTLTKTHAVAVQFLDAGGLSLLLSLPTSCLFPGFDNIAATIIRHVLEDPQTLQQAMEFEIRHSLVAAANRHSNGRVSPRNFLSSLSSAISRDPVIFMRAAQTICQVEMVGERPYIVLLKDREKDKSKEREKEKDKSLDKDKTLMADSKAALGNINSVASGNGHGKVHDSKSAKMHRKYPPSFVSVIELLLDSVCTYVPPSKDNVVTDAPPSTDMDIDAAATKGKGKAIASVSEDNKTCTQEAPASLAKVVFVLKLLTEILSMYASSAHVLLRKDAEISSYKAPSLNGPTAVCTGGIFHHVLHKFLPYSRSAKKEKKADGDWRHKLASRASQFLVASCVRSSEARKRVFNEISLVFNEFVESCNGFRPPNYEIQAFCDLLNDVLAARTPTGSYISAEASVTFIDVGLVGSLTRTLQMLDLDHADSPKVVTGLLKALELVTKEHVHSADSNSGKGDNSTKPPDHNQSGRTDNIGERSQSMETPSQSRRDSGPAEHIESYNAVQSFGGSEAVTDDMEHDQDLDGGFAPANEDEYMHENSEETRGLENGIDTMGIRFEIQPHEQENLDDDDEEEDEDMSEDDGDEVDDDEDDDDEEHNDLEDDVHHLPHPDTDQDDHEIDDDEFDEEVLEEDDEEDDDEEDGVILRLEEGINGINVFDRIEVFGRDPGFPNEALQVMPVEVFGSRRQGRTTSIYSLLGRTGENATPSRHPLLVGPLSLSSTPPRQSVLSAQQGQAAPQSNAEPQNAGDIDPEFLAALPPDIRAEVLAQQQAQRLHQSQELEGQPVEMDTVSIIATFPSELREEVLLTSSDAILANLTPALVAEANMLRERFAHRYNRTLFGVPPLLSRRILETLTYLARHHPNVAKILLHFSVPLETDNIDHGRGKAVMVVEETGPKKSHQEGYLSIALLLSLLNQPLYLFRSIAHLEQLLNLLEVIIDNAESQPSVKSGVGVSVSEQPSAPQISTSDAEMNTESGGTAAVVVGMPDKVVDSSKPTTSGVDSKCDTASVLLNLPQEELRLLCSLLAREGLSDNAYTLVAEVMKKLVAIVPTHSNLFITELAEAVRNLTRAAMNELHTFGETVTALLSTMSSVGAAILRVLQALSSLVASLMEKEKDAQILAEKEHTLSLSQVWDINAALEPLWLELSTCISKIESHSESAPDTMTSYRASTSKPSGVIPPLPAGTQNILPYIESFFVVCEKLHPGQPGPGNDFGVAAVSEVEDASTSAGHQKTSGSSLKVDEKHVAFLKFSEKHRKLLNAFIRQNPGLLEKSFSLMLKVPRFIDFDNKRAHFRSKIKHQHDHHHNPLRISVRRAYILEDSYNQLRMRSTQDLKGRLTVHFQGEEGIDAGGLTREWYQLLSRVIFDKGALLFTTVGNESTFQPNPNSVYQTEHLSYFKFVGRVVGKALFDGQLLDVHFTRSFYKHILEAKVTYHDIEAIDPDYFKNLKWMLENDISDVLDLTFSIDADEEKLILYERTEVTDYELIPGGRNIKVTEENKHQYVDLVAEHRLTTAIRPQINAFMKGFTELVAKELISIFNDKELELLISGLPDIDLDDMRANTEYSGYSPASPVIQWFWEVAQGFSKEDKARLLQFVTGTSKVPLEGFSALQGISGSQKFQIHKAYGSADHLPSAHTCFNQLDLPEYPSKQHLEERLLLAIHEANEGFGFG
ncbi:hypothetical protein C1H46_020791 [Malus baccata]|uniref:HECT-type E3 ubiquitin transferase n=1 Tax=Malus baccata TaxID=106549 RepID=A0A540M4A5_MALBA|nr:hypothetical protein C1H46_020791 [Malus baccata]